VEAARSERYRRDHCCWLACNTRRMRRATGYKDNRGMRDPGERRGARYNGAPQDGRWVSLLKLPGERVRRKERKRASERERERERRRERERPAVNGPLRNLIEEKGDIEKVIHTPLYCTYD